MPQFETQFFKIGEKLIAYKNRLFEVVQYKLDEGKDKNQIIKELKEEFEPTIDVMHEIECKFFSKEAGTITDKLSQYNKLMDSAISMRNVGTLSEENFNKVKQVYESLDDPYHVSTYLDKLKKTLVDVIHTSKWAAKKRAFIPQIMFSDSLHDINNLWEDGYITQSEVNEITEKYGDLEEDIMYSGLEEEKARSIFENFIGPILTSAEEREGISEQFNEGLITEEEKADMLSKVSKIIKTPGKEEWKVFTEKGNPMGTYTSETKAKERITQMEMFKHMGQDLTNTQVGDEVIVDDEVGEVLINTDTLMEIKLPDGQIKAIPKIN